MKFGKSGLASALDNKSARAAAVVVVSAIVVFFAVLGSPRAAGVFAPTINLELSTTRANAHPDARLTIDNTGSDENIKSISVALPNGFWGSLAAATKCDYADAQVDNCSAASQVGTVDTTAKIDNSDSRLRGKIYLTEPAPANVNNDPAGITIIVPAKVGNVDLGNVIVNGRVGVRTATLPPVGPTGSVTGAVGAIQGINTTFTDVPQSITDTNLRTVSFKLLKMRADLSSDLDGPNPPLLTNPSTCGSFVATASFGSWDLSSASATGPTGAIDQCNSTSKFGATFDATLTTNVAGALTGLKADVTFPTGSASTKTVTVKLPSVVGPNLPSFGTSADQCPSATNIQRFNPAACPTQARVGKVSIKTPLLEDPVEGDVWLINKSPIPNIGIDVGPTTGPNNPAGVNIRLVGISATTNEDSSCDTLFAPSCKQQIVSTFTNVPDAPVESLSMNIDGPDRTGVGPVTLSGKLFNIASSNDEACQPVDDFTASFTSNTSVGVTALRADVVDSQTFSGCGQRETVFDDVPTSPVGKSTTDTTPTVPFSDAPGSSPGSSVCFFGNQYNGSGDDLATPCTTPVTASSALPFGISRVGVIKNNLIETRAMAIVATPGTPDNTAPTTTITSPPTSVDNDSPSIDFTSNESANFQCAINPGNAITTAYLPCGSSSASTSGTFSAADLFAGLTYTVGVRAQDAAGNVGAADTATFSVDIPFAPQFQADISTYAARQHPDLDVTVTNPSHEDIEDITFNLPDGFFGGLTGVASLCPTANADAGTCPASSQVGTVDAEADVDESTIRNSGTVYLTEPRDPATEPASLSIKLTPAIQDVVFNTIIVNASLKIRGVAQGIDAFALNLPRSATNTLDGTTDFDLRKMKLKLRTGAGATYPLLTNPSDCRPMSYDASFKGYDASTGSDSQPFQATGCASLPFAPALAINATDPSGKPAGPSTNIKRSVLNVAANLASTPDQAGIKNVVLTMPLPMTIDVQKLPPACTVAQQAAKACPAASQVGNVSATSPLLTEPLTGAVYILERNPATPTVVLPRLLIALRGRINVDIVATNSFVNVSQIVTRFDTLPDVPLSSFAININNFLTTRNNACDFGIPDWNITGTLTGFNGSASNVVIPQKFDCPEAYGPTATFKLKKNKSKTTLSVATKAQVGKKLKKKLTLTLPKGLTFNKAGFTKKKLSKLVTVKVNGKKLKTNSKCFKKVSSTKFQVGFCKKTGTTVSISFKSGTLKATKKLAKKPKFKMSAVDSDNKTKKVTFLTE